MGRPRKKSAKDIAKETELLIVQKIQDKVARYLRGDETAAPYDHEMDFLQKVVKNANEESQGEALISYLGEMDTSELESYHERLKKSLEEEGLN